MKKTMSWFLVLTLCLSLCACGNQSGDNSVADTTASGHTHTWKEANCTTPKTCADCGQTEGNVGEHTFTPTCAVCGRENSEFVPLLEGSWNYIAGEGDSLTYGSFDFFRYEDSGETAVSIGYTFYKTLDKYAQEQDMAPEEVRDQYKEMLRTINDEEYVFDGWGMENSSDRLYKEENGVITIEFMSMDWDENGEVVWTVNSKAVLQRTGMAELTVTESSNSEIAVGLKITGKVE